MMLPEGGGAFSVENSAIGIGNSFKNKSAPAANLRRARVFFCFFIHGRSAV